MNGENLRLWQQINSINANNISCDLGDCISIKFDNCDEKFIYDLAMDLRPWRKGPFRLNELFIDSEWQSFIKFNLLAKYMELENKIVADIGCNNGYYMFKMLNLKPKNIIGFDPSIKTFLQFSFINKFINSNIKYELMGLENIFNFKFDVIFCLGVLYHRSDPISSLKKLKSLLNKGGELFLDTMFIDIQGEYVLSPKNTYSKIKNIYFIPSLNALLNWCERAKFKNIEILDSIQTSLNEQRKTNWITGQSLNDFLDKDDKNLTIEGYPAPKRIYLKLSI